MWAQRSEKLKPIVKTANSKTHNLRGHNPIVAVTPAGTIPRGEEADVASVTANFKNY